MICLGVLQVFCNFQGVFCVSLALDKAEDIIFDLDQLPVAFQFFGKINKFSFKLSDQSYRYLLNK